MITGLVLLVARLVAVLGALSITATSYRAYRRTGEATFGYSMAGFACLSLGLGVESFLLRAAPLALPEVHAVESSVFAVGFVVLFFSLRRPS